MEHSRSGAGGRAFEGRAVASDEADMRTLAAPVFLRASAGRLMTWPRPSLNWLPVSLECVSAHRRLPGGRVRLTGAITQLGRAVRCPERLSRLTRSIQLALGRDEAGQEQSD